MAKQRTSAVLLITTVIIASFLFFKDGIWIVSYSEDTNLTLLGGGLPVVRIKQSNGKVISCLLQK